MGSDASLRPSPGFDELAALQAHIEFLTGKLEEIYQRRLDLQETEFASVFKEELLHLRQKFEALKARIEHEYLRDEENKKMRRLVAERNFFMKHAKFLDDCNAKLAENVRELKLQLAAAGQEIKHQKRQVNEVISKEFFLTAERMVLGSIGARPPAVGGAGGAAGAGATPVPVLPRGRSRKGLHQKRLLKFPAKVDVPNSSNTISALLVPARLEAPFQIAETKPDRTPSELKKNPLTGVSDATSFTAAVAVRTKMMQYGRTHSFWHHPNTSRPAKAIRVVNLSTDCPRDLAQGGIASSPIPFEASHDPTPSIRGLSTDKNRFSLTQARLIRTMINKSRLEDFKRPL